MIQALLYGAGATLAFVGLAAALLPVVPGIPVLFAGLWLIAGADEYRHVGIGWLLGIGAVGAIAINPLGRRLGLVGRE